jgi:hypothetical protein
MQRTFINSENVNIKVLINNPISPAPLGASYSSPRNRLEKNKGYIALKNLKVKAKGYHTIIDLKSIVLPLLP